ncbi:hypothetical protein BS47DRAFT_1397658 [Hydnum rufescens UP504]|uniref:Uncharacterized protein n=1 Tax=Hydnum rufescens UP504 TaxID=1448309 RepID=A0A9P6DP58_9AGAM|nr:hypothetical protein BS47DRAFT_1397658 [Hydnum rufescens UP504]
MFFRSFAYRGRPRVAQTYFQWIWNLSGLTRSSWNPETTILDLLSLTYFCLFYHQSISHLDARIQHMHAPRTAANNINGSVNGNGQLLTVNTNLNIAPNLGNGVYAYSDLPSQSQQLQPSASGPQAYSTASGAMGWL